MCLCLLSSAFCLSVLADLPNFFGAHSHPHFCSSFQKMDSIGSVEFNDDNAEVDGNVLLKLIKPI